MISLIKIFEQEKMWHSRMPYKSSKLPPMEPGAPIHKASIFDPETTGAGLKKVFGKSKTVQALRNFKDNPPDLSVKGILSKSRLYRLATGQE